MNYVTPINQDQLYGFLKYHFSAFPDSATVLNWLNDVIFNQNHTTIFGETEKGIKTKYDALVLYDALRQILRDLQLDQLLDRISPKFEGISEEIESIIFDYMRVKEHYFDWFSFPLPQNVIESAAGEMPIPPDIPHLPKPEESEKWLISYMVFQENKPERTQTEIKQNRYHLGEIALICHYNNIPLTHENSGEIANLFGFTNGKSLMNKYNDYVRYDKLAMHTPRVRKYIVNILPELSNEGKENAQKDLDQIK